MALTYVFEVKDNGSATFQKINNTVNVLNQSLIKVDNSTNIFNKSLGKLGTAAANFGGIIMAKGVSMLKDFGKEMVDSYDSAAKLSQNIGITAESVLGLRHAAELSKVGADALDKNMEKLSKTMFEAASGNKSAGDSFKQLGIDVKNSDGSLKKSDQVLMEMADKFKALPPGAERAAAAMNIFGKSGASMVSMLKDGSGALQKMVDEGAGAAGNVQSISEAMEKLNDAGTRAKAALMGMLAGLVDSAPFKAMVSGFNGISEALIKWNAESKKGAEQEREANKERLAAALYHKAQIEHLAKSEQDKFAKQHANAKEGIKDITARLKLGNDEMELMINQANAMALLNKMRERGGNLEDHDLEKLAKYNEKIKEIEKRQNTSVLPKPKGDDEAAKKIAAENKRLQDWLDNYKKSKRTENEIAAASYDEQLENFEGLYKRKKITLEEYNDFAEEAENDFNAKLKEIADKQTEERVKKEEATQGKVWELRKIAARSYGDIEKIEIEQINSKYAKEIELAKNSGIDIKLIKQAQQSEIAAINAKAIESERRQQDLIRGYRETAAQTEQERMALQMEAIESKYAAEREMAQGNADMLVAIEAAKNAEIQRQADQITQMRISQAEQIADAEYNIVQAAATIGKAGGETQKGIALSQAIINTALAVTKAAASAPPPLNALAIASASAQGAAQIATIKAQKFARGGMIPGSNTLIMANEQGREAILNPMAVRAVGGEAGVNALNRGTSNTYNNNRSNTVNINVNTSIMTQKTFRDEIEPVLKRAEGRR